MANYKSLIDEYYSNNLKCENQDKKIIRIHNTHQNISNIDLTKKYIQKPYSFKSNGLWYSLANTTNTQDDSWIDFWVEGEKMCKMFKHRFEITLKQDDFVNFDEPTNSQNKVLRLYEKDVIAFSKKYQETFEADFLENSDTYKHIANNDLFHFINWKKIEQEYAGIEFPDYSRCSELRFNSKYIWWNTIDAKTGVIWNLDIIDKVEKIAN